ncbi:RHS repeat-associated core domain-containing protein [Tannerella forsythia]|uniref:RHS repeat-associated core domain-containing protein n=1 Tax=Tannerella forsythia TaxID=28112 RepID=UPI003C6F58BA
MVSFEYDPLGRRISKTYKEKTTRWVWDGNVPLHEWTEEENVTTWLFEEGTFIPAAKIVGDKSYSIITDYLGTPTEMFNSDGEKTWSAELDIYGSVRNFAGRSLSDCPFRYQGQYEDEETGLYYNRFRYYSPDEGRYISQDPIGLAGGMRLYNYVHDSNVWTDILGLYENVVFPKDKVITQVTIQMQGDRKLDFKAANAEAGLNGVRGNPTIDAHRQMYGDVTWHHATYDPKTNTATMQLVRTSDHEASLPHQGSVKEFEDAIGTKYGSADAKEKAKKLNSH